MSRAAELLARAESLDLPLDERAVAGDELAALGDPRAAAIDRVLIPEGPLLRGEGRSVFVSSFRIDRYPVTVAAYAEMVSAGGYARRSLWSPRGWAWKIENNISAPRFWGEKEWAPYLVANHPVVGVSAHEAEAYATFRDARLPTEAEWEKACAGASGCRHPWGEEWIDDAAAMRTVGPRCTLPIGVFPRGKSAYGVRDLVGCVWQWCRDAADEDADLDDEDPFVDPDLYAEGAPRVTRGGAWNTLAWSVCCTSKNGYPPSARFSNLGFRCVADP